ncbi:hypothetical protein KIN20_010043 [Parelaphostrongylus tenuis]|uniref:Uncharacterized protein n=1 Tax=Parelaphostrongylus tenuis TaxID=148309 RepID=A0AAD5MSQ7_PARTN|nr:hypothetical protein KIN20_010043 [Parelaphostrongylus tenuis]
MQAGLRRRFSSHVYVYASVSPSCLVVEKESNDSGKEERSVIAKSSKATFRASPSRRFVASLVVVG